MPPGWKKAVNSKTLMDSFATVDKVLIKGKKRSETRICGTCCGNFVKSRDRSMKKTEFITGVLGNLNCSDYTEQQMARILTGLKDFLETGDMNQDLQLINKRDRRFTCRHGGFAPPSHPCDLHSHL